jgi:hypothetical protein
MQRKVALRSLVVAVAGLTVIGATLAARPLNAAAAPTVYYFHGTASDDACRTQTFVNNTPPCAFFDTTFPTQTSATGFTQTPGASGNANQSANVLSVYWYGNFTGSASGAIYFDWYWSGASGTQPFTITVYSDPSPLIATTNTQIAQTVVSLNINPTPTLNHTVVPLKPSCPCAVTSKLLIQATNGVGTGTANYDSTAVPSDFFFGPAPVIGGSTATVGPGTQGFANYGSPPGFQNRDGAQRPNSGEPSIGADWVTGKIMDMAGTQVSQIGFDTSTKPPTATWNDVTTVQLANVSEDSILFTNSEFNPNTTSNRTWAEDFLLNPGCNANMAYTDNDGGHGGGPGGADTTTSWTAEQCPVAEGPDHPSVGAGPYFGGAPISALDTNEIVYYCSQNVLVAAGAECTHSTDGGMTWVNPTHIFGTGTPCNSIHGHIRTDANGRMFVPQGSCSGHQGTAISTDNGASFGYSLVTDATAGATDPSIAADRGGNLYYGYQDGSLNSHPKIAISHDHGLTWGPSTDVGDTLGIQNSVFPEVIAGDANRAAFAFLGTTTAGDYQVQGFRGVWYMYVAYTYDGGNSWQVVNATPNDPVQTGCVDNGGATGGTYAGCRNMLDFNDITVDKQGRVYVAYTDGCTDSTNVPAADRQAGNPPATVPAYNCDANTTVNDTNCATSPGGQTFSESASEYSYPTCTYGRQQALVRQVCGQGLFAANDPGFNEGPACSALTGVPEAPWAAALVVGGGAAAGVVAIAARRRRRGPELAH